MKTRQKHHNILSFLYYVRETENVMYPNQYYLIPSQFVDFKPNITPILLFQIPTIFRFYDDYNRFFHHFIFVLICCNTR